MPILNGLSAAMSKAARATAQWRERIENERIVRKQRDGVTHSGSQSIRARARELQLDVVARGSLRRVRLHRGGPGGDDFRRRNIDEDRRDVARFGFRNDGVEQTVARCVCGGRSRNSVTPP